MNKFTPIFTIPALNKELDLFWQLYELESIITSTISKPDLKSKNNRTCRFCKKNYPTVKFKNEAHIIPHQLGNKNLISDFECDECNKKFGLYENDLAYFLGMSRTILQTKGKKGVPNFHSPNDIVTAKLIDILNVGEGIEIRKKYPESDSLVVNNENGEIKISYLKNSYRPFNVYKALLKMSLSCINDTYVDNYKQTFDLLNNNKIEHYLYPFAKVMKTSMSFDYIKDNPQVYIYKKRFANLKCPTHCMVLYFQNMLFQIAIPHYNDDLKFKNVGMDVFYCPPISSQPFQQDNNFIYNIIDLASTYLKKDDFEMFTMKIDLSNLNGFSKFNPKTGEFSDIEFTEIDSPKIQSIVLVPKGFVIPIDKLKSQ